MPPEAETATAGSPATSVDGALRTTGSPKRGVAAPAAAGTTHHASTPQIVSARRHRAMALQRRERTNVTPRAPANRPLPEARRVTLSSKAGVTERYREALSD